MSSDNLLKNPFNYTGGKYKLLKQILPVFPEDINTFVDLFCGGGDIFLNVDANKTIALDNLKPLIEIHNEFKNKDIKDIISSIENYINKYDLTKDNKEAYLSIRNDYNKSIGKDPLFLYTICCFAFNNQIRFNNKGEFNSPFGRRRWNPSLEKKLRGYCSKVKSINIDFICNDFCDLDITKLKENDFVYADPPYLLSLATYNERNIWSEEKEKQLLQLLEDLNKKSVKFALSNLLETKGKIHPYLEDWTKKNSFKMLFLNSSYGGSSYQRDNSQIDQEVLIMNY